jgi:hypothetical protein
MLARKTRQDDDMCVNVMRSVSYDCEIIDYIILIVNW